MTGVLNDINNTNIQRSIDKLNQEESVIIGSWNTLNDSIKRKRREIHHITEMLIEEEAKLAKNHAIKNYLEGYARKLSKSSLEGLPVSLDGGTTWCVVTSQRIDEHGNITVSDGESTRSVAIKDVVISPSIMHSAEELRQAPTGTTIFLGKETFKKVGDTTWLKRERKVSRMDGNKREWVESDKDITSEVSAWDMEELMHKMLFLVVATWGDISVERWRW